MPDSDAFHAACAARNLLAQVNADTDQRRSVRWEAGAAVESLERFIEEADSADSGRFFEEGDAPTVADLRRVFPHAAEPVPLEELERREWTDDLTDALGDLQITAAAVAGTTGDRAEAAFFDAALDAFHLSYLRVVEALGRTPQSLQD